jgi:hypothetical protein
MTHSSANDIAALPPGVKLTTLDNGLVIIVRRSPLLQFEVPAFIIHTSRLLRTWQRVSFKP